MELLYCYLNCISSGKHLTRHLNVIKIMWILLARPKPASPREIQQQRGDFYRRNNTFHTGNMLFYLKTLQKLKLNDSMCMCVCVLGVGGYGGLSTSPACWGSIPELKQLVSISSQHLPTCLFYCGESKPFGFNKAIISAQNDGPACLSCFSFFLHWDA